MKEWKQPMIMGLGVKFTKDEDCQPGKDKGLLFHICDYCYEGFWTHSAEIEHEANCYKNPVHKPVAPLPGEGEGGPIPTFS